MDIPKWSFNHFVINITSRRFMIWVVCTIFMFNWHMEKVVAYIWAGVTALYYCGDILIDALATAIRNVKIGVKGDIN